MSGWFEISLLAGSAALLIAGLMRHMRAYRSLVLGASALLLLTAFFPREGNLLGQWLLAGVSGTPRIPTELFGVAWWVLGAWLLKSVLDLVLRRTIFPNDNQPHARRLFADLASALIYVVAFVGIMDTVLKQPISAVLATSGVLAVVLALALQSTLADVFSGLAINVERPFGAGDWITMSDGVEGQIIEIDWRATRIRSWSNDMIVIPNSVVAKAIVTNHRRRHDPHIYRLRVTVDSAVAPGRVLAALREAAVDVPGSVAGSTAKAFACEFRDTLIAYELTVPIESFARKMDVQSELVQRVAAALAHDAIPVGSPALAVRMVPVGGAPPVVSVVKTLR